MNLYIEAFAWTLLHFMWQGSAIAAVYKLIARDGETLSPTNRYNLALAALLGMSAASLSTAIYEVVRLGHLYAAPTLSAATTAQLMFMTDDQQLFRWIDGTWLLGSLILLARSTGGQWRHHRTRKGGYFLKTGELYERFLALTLRMDLRGSVRLRVHMTDAGPFVSGIFRSVVYLPLSVATNLSMEELECVLIHELAHVYRADYIWNAFQTIMETLFFFHPAVWWIGRILREQREFCCDAMVIESCSNPILYAKTLINLAELRIPHTRLAVPLIGRHGSMGLLRRIEFILGEESPSERSRFKNLNQGLTIAGFAAATFVFSVLALAPMNSVLHSQGRASDQHVLSAGLGVLKLSNTAPSLLVATQYSGGTHATARKNVPRRPKPDSIVNNAPENPDHAHLHTHPHEHHHHHSHNDDV